MSWIAIVAFAGLLLLVLVAALFFNWIIQHRLDTLETTLVRHLEQLYSMHYNLLRKHGFSHEDLKEGFPPIRNPSV